MDSFGITGLYVEAQSTGSVNLPTANIYASDATSKYQAFLDKVNETVLQVSPSEVNAVLMEDFNAQVGTDTDTWKGVM